MDIKKENDQQKEPKAASGAKDIFDWWNQKAKIKEEDSTLTIFKKIGIRLAGIILLVIFSPVLIVIFLFVIAMAL